MSYFSVPTHDHEFHQESDPIIRKSYNVRNFILILLSTSILALLVYMYVTIINYRNHLYTSNWNWDYTSTNSSQPLRSPRTYKHTNKQQDHTAVCINFNWSPNPVSLSILINVQSQFHKYITIISPDEPSQLPFDLPSNIYYIQCVATSVVLGEEHKGSPSLGVGGALQHVCAASCFDYYANFPISGVLYHSDDMFVNYHKIFNSPSDYPLNKSWAPSGGLDEGSLLDPLMLLRYDPFWFRQPVTNPYAFINNIQVLQSNKRFLQAFRLAYHNDLTIFTPKGIADIFYLPHSQLKQFVELINYLSAWKEQYFTCNDTRKDVAPNSIIQIHVGLSMSEWFVPTLMRLSAALSLIDSQVLPTTADLPLIIFDPEEVRYLWGSDRMNQTRLKQLCLHDVQTTVVHPIKLSDKDHRDIYLEGYRTS